MTTRPIDSKFRDILDSGFRCEPASNGGWVVWDTPEENMRRNTMIAAYSDTDALLAGLSLLLTTPAPVIASLETTGAVQ